MRQWHGSMALARRWRWRGVGSKAAYRVIGVALNYCANKHENGSAYQPGSVMARNGIGNKSVSENQREMSKANNGNNGENQSIMRRKA
jgi:hypothetical protein